jgi:hypothetical protein
VAVLRRRIGVLAEATPRGQGQAGGAASR